MTSTGRTNVAFSRPYWRSRLWKSLFHQQW